MKSLASFARVVTLACAAILASTGIARAETGTFEIIGYVPAYGIYVVGEGDWEGTPVPDGNGGYTIEGYWEGDGIILGSGIPWYGGGYYSGAGTDINDITVNASGVWDGLFYVQGFGGPYYADGVYDSLRVD